MAPQPDRYMVRGQGIRDRLDAIRGRLDAFALTRTPARPRLSAAEQVSDAAFRLEAEQLHLAGIGPGALYQVHQVGRVGSGKGPVSCRQVPQRQYETQVPLGTGFPVPETGQGKHHCHRGTARAGRDADLIGGIPHQPQAMAALDRP